MDNRIFNVNGRLDRGGEQLLLKTLELAFEISGHKAAAWRVSLDHGLILDWCDNATGSNRFPSPVTATQVMPMVASWLHSDEAKQVKCEDWDADADHDGHNGPGWRVYCGDRDHVQGWQAIVAVKPAFMWYGK